MSPTPEQRFDERHCYRVAGPVGDMWEELGIYADSRDMAEAKAAAIWWPQMPLDQAAALIRSIQSRYVKTIFRLRRPSCSC